MSRLTYGRNPIQLRVASHPKPEAKTIEANWVIRVECGPVGYKTSDGEFFRLEGE